MEVVKLEDGVPALLKHLDDLRGRVEAGETIGLLVIEEGREGFSYARTRVSIQGALLIACRVQHVLQHAWDKATGR